MLEALECSINSQLASIEMDNYERHRRGKPPCSCGRPDRKCISAPEFHELLGSGEDGKVILGALAEAHQDQENTLKNSARIYDNNNQPPPHPAVGECAEYIYRCPKTSRTERRISVDGHVICSAELTFCKVHGYVPPTLVHLDGDTMNIMAENVGDTSKFAFADHDGDAYRVFHSAHGLEPAQLVHLNGDISDCDIANLRDPSRFVWVSSEAYRDDENPINTIGKDWTAG